jgi:divinyl chlorophyllide a 8-vinyl-reductase
MNAAAAPALKNKVKKRIMLLGATGTVGRATLAALLRRGFHVTCFVRSQLDVEDALPNLIVRKGNIATASELYDKGFCGEQFDAVVSCLASRSGAPDDAWAIDYQAHSNTLQCAKDAGVRQMVLLSAICVQKPRLAFQNAKLAFEKELIESGLVYSIVRPTALFKSLSGQIERLRQGKSFLVFGNGALTSCKPISDADLADYLVQCLEDTELHNRILPIGGPGTAITPLQQGEELFRLLGRKPRYTHVPVALFNIISTTLSVFGMIVPELKRKAEFARIGGYYATESMLVLNQQTGHYDEAATPSTGIERLFDHYAAVITSRRTIERSDHSVF